MSPGGVQQSDDRVPPAGGSRAKGLAMELLDGLRGRLVQPARFRVRMLVAQVGADDDQSPIAVPERFQDLVHHLGVGPGTNPLGIEELPQRRAGRDGITLRPLSALLRRSGLTDTYPCRVADR